MGEIRVGCSGWSYPHWRGPFYGAADPRDYLEQYVQFFDSVEVNMTFYKFPTEPVLKSWFKRTPLNFLFAIKVHRSITHRRNLHKATHLLESLINTSKTLGDKLGPFLVQLPPAFEKDVKQLETILPFFSGHRVAFEFRNQSWQDHDVTELLNRYEATMVMLGSRFENNYKGRFDFAYIRWHGRGGPFDDYSHDEIARWARHIELMSQEMDVYGFWNNDSYAFAPKDCLELRRQLGLKLQLN